MDHEYITTREALTRAIERLSAHAILGVDTEAAGYHRYHDRISLVQISSTDENVLIDPLEIEDLSPLATLFDDSRIQKIFHDADFDLRILDRDLGLRVVNLFDTQIAAAFVGAPGLGLGAVVEQFLGLSLPKAYQRADWAERPLTEGMREYAATDTAHLLDLREALLAKLEELGRLEWAREEFVRREATRWTPPDPSDEPYLRIKGVRDLTPRGLAILREVYAWREAVGKERDQATFRVLSNKSMLEIGAKAPKTASELAAIGGVSTGLVDRRGRDLLAAVRRGEAVPDDERPRFAPPRRWERDLEVEERSERLRQTRNRIAGELGLDPGFMISRALLDEVARNDPTSPAKLLEIPDIRRWQVEVFGDELLNARRENKTP